ncbi:hypothetical protein ACV229_27030 [Burkholderia sp. MR1-5-21]
MRDAERSIARIASHAALVACLFAAIPASHADIVRPTGAAQAAGGRAAISGALMRVKVSSQRNTHPAPSPHNQSAHKPHHA